MSGWFAKLMEKGRTRSPGASTPAGASHNTAAPNSPADRDVRYDVIVQRLRKREAEDRDARERRQQWYGQPRKSDPGTVAAASEPGANRLYQLPTKVPCRATPEAKALLDKLSSGLSGATVTFRPDASGRQAVMLAASERAEPRQIGWVEHGVQADPALCNVRHQGLQVETDGGRMLVLRFLYPPTAVRMSSRRKAPESTVTGETGCLDFSEIRPALDLKPSDKAASPRLVWLTKPPEAEAMGALQSRDYEAFYARFKLEVQAGIWSALSALLASMPSSHWHQGTHYTVVREPDPMVGRLHQRTVDDSGRVVDLGVDQVYDSVAATDILLLYLDGDILADITDICFGIQGLDSADAWFLKEEFFSVIRRFWSGAPSLVSSFGSDFETVVRMSRRTVPMPTQAPLLKQDWTNLRQALVDRYGEGGRKAAELVGPETHRPSSAPAAWPFASFPAGEINLGLRLVYRQEWRQTGVERGEVIRTEQRAANAVVPAAATRNLDEVLAGAAQDTVRAMKWPLDFEGSINRGVRALAARTDMGLESECRESSRDTCTDLSDLVTRLVSRRRDEAAEATGTAPASAPTDGESSADENTDTLVYRSVLNRFEVLTRPAEIQNVILVAEKLPAPADIDLAWVRRYARVLARVLLDEQFRGALETLGRPDSSAPGEEQLERLYEHLRAGILHYQQAIWQQEDSQHRVMRYRKAGRKVPLDWRFELQSKAALTIDALRDQLCGANVDGQFVAWSTGREAELDQVIDPSGPIGYYANCAIYRMRPEFGSADLFAMLHFFKSPWLRPHPETGEPDVADPEEIQAGADAAALEQFRRERTRRIALEGVVTEVMHRAAPEAGTGGPNSRAIDFPADGYRLLMEGAPGLALLSATRRRMLEAGWALFGEDGAGTMGLAAGSRGAASGAGDPAQPLIVALGAGEPALGVRAGGADVPAHEPVIAVREDARLTPSQVAGRAS